MNTKFGRWALRITGTAAVLAPLAAGLGAASASAQPAAATHVTSSAQRAIPNYTYHVYKIYSRNQHSRCVSQNNYFIRRHRHSYCRYYSHYTYRGHRYSNVYVLFVS
jgi:hypothetical protein